MSYIPEPVTRIDKYLAYIAGNMDVTLPNHPITRKEHYLAAWAEKSGFEDVDVTGKPPLTLENAIGEPLKGLRIYGKSKQVTTTGAQLLDYDNLMPDMAYGTDGALQSNKGYASSQLIKVTGNSPYTISGLSNIAVIILQYSSEKVLLSRKPSNTNGTYTTLEDTCYIGLTFYANVTVDMLKNVMLNAGSTPLPWEPYTGGLPSPSPEYPQEIESVGQDMNNIMLSISSTALPHEPYHEPQSMNISTPNGLPGIPVSSGGNYTDKKGQQWVCNTIEFWNGVAEMVQRIEYIDLKAGRWQKVKRLDATGGLFFISQIKKPALYGTSVTGATSNILRIGNPYTDFGDYIWILTNNGVSECRIGFADSTIDSTEKLTNLFNSLPEAYAMYCIAEPIRTPLSPETIAAYKQLHTYKGTTIIDNDAGAYMSVRYEKMK